MTDKPEPGGKVIRLNVGGTEGKLTTPEGSRIPVRVYDRGGDYLMLVLMLDAGEELGTDALEPLVLEYVSARGVVRFRGQAVLEDRDLVRFEVATQPEVTQRREFVRVPSIQNVVLGGEAVAEPEVRVDERPARKGGLQLDPQLADVHVDRPVPDSHLPAPYEPEQLLPRDDPIDAPRQLGQET